jgi:prepilin-type processing-associated H-X9-DG protein
MKKSLWQIKKSFSIIELMTVILVVLLLMSLLIPTFVNLKMNARTALCKNQMRQLGVLTISYMTDYGGFLPNDKSLDIGGSPLSHDIQESVKSIGGNTLLYEGWNGHLLPYMQSLNSNFTKKARLNLGSSGIAETWDQSIQKWVKKPSKKPDCSSFIIEDAIKVGGYNELKIFICPEIACNTYDIGYSNTYNQIRIPRISQMSGSGSTSPFLSSGAPITYFANNIFFGCDSMLGESIKTETRNSLRLDQISDVSQKAFVIENGCLNAAYPFFSGPYYETADLAKIGMDRERLNFVHDTSKPFWTIDVTPTSLLPIGYEMMNKFNTKFSGKAEIIYGINAGYTIISYIQPFDNPIVGKSPFKDFFIANPLFTLGAGYSTFDFPEYHYKTGKMNVLFGDGAVALKSYSWLSQNRELISNLSNR